MAAQCQCEATTHFVDERGPRTGHKYLDATAGQHKALYVGPICDPCARAPKCMANYLTCHPGKCAPKGGRS